MMRVFGCFFLYCAFLFAAEDISGFWKTIDEQTGQAQSIIAIYSYDGLYYGRIIGSLDDKGKMKDSIYHPVERAPGVVGTPFYSGLDIIWGLEDKGSKFKGKILDPQHGDVYNSELWIDHGDLIVRGKLWIFGRNQTWLRATAADFPKRFKIPDLKTFVPSIPTVK